VRRALGESAHDPADPMGEVFGNGLATFAAFEAAMIRLRTRAGMASARGKGKLRGKPPTLSDTQQRELRRTHGTGGCPTNDLAEVFSVSRPTVHQTIAWASPVRRSLMSDWCRFRTSVMMPAVERHATAALRSSAG
jgi:DNA invertase Pin-like site-specific DNA recombinase